jgi:hypothetical protein
MRSLSDRETGSSATWKFASRPGTGSGSMALTSTKQLTARPVHAPPRTATAVPGEHAQRRRAQTAEQTIGRVTGEHRPTLFHVKQTTAHPADTGTTPCPHRLACRDLIGRGGKARHSQLRAPTSVAYRSQLTMLRSPRMPIPARAGWRAAPPEPRETTAALTDPSATSELRPAIPLRALPRMQRSPPLPNSRATGQRTSRTWSASRQATPLEPTDQLKAPSPAHDSEPGWASPDPPKDTAARAPYREHVDDDRHRGKAYQNQRASTARRRAAPPEPRDADTHAPLIDATPRPIERPHRSSHQRGATARGHPQRPTRRPSPPRSR